jgi:uncharacterized membrane-anchored protein YhcB (DUF1043 family)
VKKDSRTYRFFRLLITGMVIGLVIGAVFMGLTLLSGGKISLNGDLLQSIGYYIYYSVILTLINSTYFDYVNESVKWERYKKYRILLSALGGIGLTMLGIFFIRLTIHLWFEGKSWETFVETERAIYYVVALLITFVVSLFFHALYFYKGWQEKKVKEQKIIAGSASARFDALKNQLDPHFLFNSLNVLTSLIDEDPKQAQRFTTSLSKVYRYVLEQKNKDLVTVDEELAFARTYVQLLKMRFEDGLQFDIPERVSNPEAKIVPLSLQLLLENAVKHNVVTSSRPLSLKVYEEGDRLVVSNNLQEKQVVKKSSGVGLQNIQQRYHILSKRAVEIDKTRQFFRVSLPILTQQVKVIESQEEHLDAKRYQKAKERVEAIKAFYGNLLSYLIVIPFLWWLNTRTTDFIWAIFPTLGWGLGLTFHALEAFDANPFLGRKWEERKIQELMDKDDF